MMFATDNETKRNGGTNDRNDGYFGYQCLRSIWNYWALFFNR